MHARCRAFDWASTPIGAPDGWPAELRTTVRLVLASGIPACILWGRSYVQIYNDAMARVYAGKHPGALGHTTWDVWPEAWAQNEPLFARVMAGETVFVENAPYESHRHGHAESMHITVSFSPVTLEDGSVGGIFSNLVETTDVIAQRRLAAERVELIAHLEREKSRLTTVFQHAPTFLAIMMGPSYTFTAVNDAYYQLVGHRDSIGRPLAEVVPEAAEQGFIALLDDVMRTGEPFIGRELPFVVQRTAHGPAEMRYIDQVYLPYVEADGTRSGIVAHGHDVTTQVEARLEIERLLAESNAQRDELAMERANSSAVLESMRDHYFTLDSEFRFRTMNRSMRELLQDRANDFLGATHWEVLPGSLGTTVEASYRRVMDQRIDVHFTHHYTGDGADTYIEVDAYPTQDGGIAVFWRDVSSHVAAEQALAESEARFRAVQDASPHGSTLYRPVRDDDDRIVDFEYVYVNRVGAAMAGMTTAELIGRRLLEVFPHAIPNGTFERYTKAVESKQPIEWEARDIREGANLGVHFIIVPFGDLLHVRYADITERMRLAAERESLLAASHAAYAEARTAEARLRDVFEQAPMAIAVMLGPEHVYTIVSPRYAETPGAGRQLLGRSVREAFPELGESAFFDIMDRVYETGVPYHAFERKVMLDDAQDGVLVEHYFNIGYQPLRNSKGAVYAIASVAYDVTEQIRARREVELARETADAARMEAEGANKAKGEFLAVMSHELRTPLNAIGGYAELLELGVHGPVTDAQRTALSRIQASQRHLLGLINGVLNYSRVEAGAVTYDITAIPLHEAVAEAESLVAPQIRAKHLRFRWEGCPKELTVRADREKLQQILLNLLSNSIKFTDARGGEEGEVEVTCERAGERVLVHVRDTGEGIEPDKLRSVFEPFVQIDQRLTRRQEGVGLGLTISRDLARGMGGDLTATSVPNEGSVFTLSLPAAND